jgi:hypothetical protein
MPSVMEVFTQVCLQSPPLIKEKRQKDVRTALKYLASAYGTTPEQLVLTPALEAGYREQLHRHFDEYPKSALTIRNTLQSLGQLWKAFHTLDRTPPVPRPRILGAEVARQRLDAQSPYRHLGWLQRHGYRIPPEQWPGDMAAQWQALTVLRAHDIRWMSQEKDQRTFAFYVSYQLLSPADRLAKLPDEATSRLQTEKKYAGYLQEIMAPAIATSWDELFDPARLNSYITWSAWRVWRWQDAILKEKEPHRPSTQGHMAAHLVTYVAKRIGHANYGELNRVWTKLGDPLKMHDKADPRHRFDLAELEAVALELMAEARRIKPNHDPYIHYPGMIQALRYQIGLIIQLAWRNPMRARNWCDAILGHNLKKDEQGQWRWRFVGDEMKVGKRGAQVNVFEPDVPPDVAVHLEEFLSNFRPHLKNADSDQHVFLSSLGTPMTRKNLWRQLRAHVNRYTDKRLYTHLLRSLFSTHHLSHGMDINSVAYAMNDTPASVLKAYNELMADTHRPIIADANRQALANRHTPLTPPIIPITPKPAKPMKSDPNQMNLI